MYLIEPEHLQGDNRRDLGRESRQIRHSKVVVVVVVVVAAVVVVVVLVVVVLVCGCGEKDWGGGSVLTSPAGGGAGSPAGGPAGGPEIAVKLFRRASTISL